MWHFLSQLILSIRTVPSTKCIQCQTVAFKTLTRNMLDTLIQRHLSKCIKRPSYGMNRGTCIKKMTEIDKRATPMDGLIRSGWVCVDLSFPLQLRTIFLWTIFVCLCAVWLEKNGPSVFAGLQEVPWGSSLADGLYSQEVHRKEIRPLMPGKATCTPPSKSLKTF